MNSFHSKLKKITKKTKNYLFCAIFFFVLSILCFAWAYYIDVNTKNNGASLHDLIYKGSKTEHEIVSLTVTEKPYVFAEYDTELTSNKYYFLMDEKYLYVGYLDYQTYLKLNQDDIQDNPVTIQGITMMIPDDVIDIALEAYNEEIGEEFLTKGNYKSYIGEICINTVDGLVDNVFQMILGICFAIIGLIYLIIYYFKKRRIRKIKNNIMLWEQLEKELEDSETVDYYKFGLCLTPNYIIDGFKGLTLVPYNDIVWVYLHEHKYNGITCNSYLMVVTKDKKKYRIAELNGFHPKTKQIYLEIMEAIYNKNQSILIGYTKENQKKIKDLYQIK